MEAPTIQIAVRHVLLVRHRYTAASQATQQTLTEMETELPANSNPTDAYTAYGQPIVPPEESEPVWGPHRGTTFRRFWYWRPREFWFACLAMIAAFIAVAVMMPTPKPSKPAPTPTVTVTQTHTAPTPTVTVTPQSRGGSPAATGGAADALNTLPVKGRAPKTGYSRDAFGQRWADIDRNGCDTRNDILRRDLTHTTLKPGTHGCVVLSGTLNDPYTGKTIAFVRGSRTSSAVQIDHVVALSNAWQTGAQNIAYDQRERLANDPLNLLAVDGPANQQKSDGDAATWLPPQKAYRCHYVARQVAVKKRYNLWVTQPEKDAISRILAACPGEVLPS